MSGMKLSVFNFLQIFKHSICLIKTKETIHLKFCNKWIFLHTSHVQLSFYVNYYLKGVKLKLLF